MKILLQFVKPVLGIIIFVLIAAGFIWRDQWLSLLDQKPSSGANKTSAASKKRGQSQKAEQEKVILSDQAIANLGLNVKSELPETYWKTFQVPGMIVDRPGRSDQGVISPVDGVVEKMNYYPGDTVRPGDVLYTIRILSETLQQTQTNLFKDTQNVVLAESKKKRLETTRGAIPESRIIEVVNEIKRLHVAIKGYQHELLSRGFSEQQLQKISSGDFVRDLDILVPDRMNRSDSTKTPVRLKVSEAETKQNPSLAFEIQESKLDLGQQVKTGEMLCLLANHRLLAIEGRAFRDETQLLERSVREGWPVEVDFQERESTHWPAIKQSFLIEYLSNVIDPVNRTFAFRMPLENQSRVVQQDRLSHVLWRFRPGQKVRLLIRVEKLENVFVLPADAVAREGAEAYVFTQNVNTFNRKQVRILARDRRHTVIANDGSLIPGSFVVQGSAEQLNRMLKSSSGDDLPEGYHIHADGSLHKNEDEGK
ncbi:efflux RND transporter periplasmic adaptor subunit [Gimesia maris]|uniref:efflux RND transporter periplasmic adaptor subunit n=1 Tax=Gimesia maris TaxID=122 RepID=UPI00241C0C9B|nr:efflux RND transporter periplasmic adaptor subunit [Gimesia maris]|tara:strand:- start:97506 stop:98945 length:1440 start_codon:yes stop_codon:yes gene_type:complete